MKRTLRWLLPLLALILLGAAIGRAVIDKRAGAARNSMVRQPAALELAAADLDRAELAAHQRLPPVRAARLELDDRLEVRAHEPVGEELGEPVRPR
ncbi:MAG: hypothetical protein ACLGHY_06480, partial [Gammaproteobacteria bacterium]